MTLEETEKRDFKMKQVGMLDGTPDVIQPIAPSEARLKFAIMEAACAAALTSLENWREAWDLLEMLPKRQGQELIDVAETNVDVALRHCTEMLSRFGPSDLPSAGPTDGDGYSKKDQP